MFIDRINTSGSLGILCLQESWTDINEDISLFELPGYTLHHQVKQCCKHSPKKGPMSTNSPLLCTLPIHCIRNSSELFIHCT